MQLGVTLHTLLGVDETNTVTTSGGGGGGFVVTERHLSAGVSETNAGANYQLFGNGVPDSLVDVDLITTSPVQSIRFETHGGRKGDSHH